jgi:ferrous iron transport protein B
MIHTDDVSCGVLVNHRVNHSQSAVLVGFAGCGMSTLFRSLTHLETEAGEKPAFASENCLELLEIPGGQALDSSCLDRLFRDKGGQMVLNVLDATDLAAGLGLTLSLLECAERMMVLVNRTDEAERQGLIVDVYGLSLELGVPTVPVVVMDPDSVLRAAIDVDCLWSGGAGRVRARKAWAEPAVRERVESICSSTLRHTGQAVSHRP